MRRTCTRVWRYRQATARMQRKLTTQRTADLRTRGVSDSHVRERQGRDARREVALVDPVAADEVGVNARDSRVGAAPARRCAPAHGRWTVLVE